MADDVAQMFYETSEDLMVDCTRIRSLLFRNPFGTACRPDKQIREFGMNVSRWIYEKEGYFDWDKKLKRHMSALTAFKDENEANLKITLHIDWAFEDQERLFAILELFRPHFEHMLKPPKIQVDVIGVNLFTRTNMQSIAEEKAVERKAGNLNSYYSHEPCYRYSSQNWRLRLDEKKKQLEEMVRKGETGDEILAVSQSVTTYGFPIANFATGMETGAGPLRCSG